MTSDHHYWNKEKMQLQILTKINLFIFNISHVLFIYFMSNVSNSQLW